MRRPTGSFWPSAAQELLLVVALADPDPAAAAWEELQPRLSLDKLEPGTVALLPMVYRSLARAGLDDPLLPRLKGIYRKSWFTNSLLVERTKESAQILQSAGIAAFFVEGVVIATRFYPELALRRSTAVDVFVCDDDVPMALAQLARAGWHEPPGSAPRPGAVRYLFDRDRNVCVVRTRLAIDFVPRSGHGRPHAPLWESLERHDLDGAELLVPSSTDLLLAICVLHTRAGVAANVQWIADAKMVLAAEIDWDRLVRIGSERQQLLRLRDTLGFFDGLPGPTPPRDVLDRLERAWAPRRERLEHRLATGSLGCGGALPVLVAEHLADTAHESALHTVASFPGRLRDRWGLARARQVPLAAGRRAIRRLGGNRRRETS